MVYDVGIDVGSVSVNCIVLDEAGHIAYEAPYLRHFGVIQKEVRTLLLDILARYPAARSVSFTGVHGELIARTLCAPHEVETIAQVAGAAHVCPEVRSIISMGGQDAAVFQVRCEDRTFRIDAFNMNGPCASGTGSFIDQQAERLASSLYGADFDLDQRRLQRVLKDFIALGMEAKAPASVACRCTVFTKSDMIHLQNKGEPLANIIAGLHYGNAANFVSTIVANRALAEPVLFVGGMAGNALQVKAFRHYYPGLLVPPHHTSLGALGAALTARRANVVNRVDPERLAPSAASAGDSFPRAPRLELRLTHFSARDDLPPWPHARRAPVWLGIDIGSTTTKYALVDESGRILHKCYVQTQGKPIEVTQRLLRALREEVGERVNLLGIATTGSGRNVVGDFLSADLVIDEITAHARAAVTVDPEIDTIFEIGGQDSKYIRIEKTHPLDFDMNKVCAAGTGSFLHELANKMKINIVGEFQDIALSSPAPVSLAERCTVFMESDLGAYAQKGAPREDLIAGLCYAVVHNYLNRVVGKRKVGKRIMFLGGPSLNRGVVAAFERVLEKPLVCPPHREVMGAYGAALALREQFQTRTAAVRERNLAELAEMEVGFSETVCRAEASCHNECKLKVYRFGGRKSVWGGECGRYEAAEARSKPVENLFEERRRLFYEAIEGRAATAEEGAPAGDGPLVGVPLSLHALEWGVLWAHLLSELGFSVVFSPRTNTRIALAGVECMTAETCFPVKVFHGHVRTLLDHADYIFAPNVISVPTPREAERGLLCPLIEGSRYMARAALGIPEKRLISPTLRLEEGAKPLAEALYGALPAALRPRSREKVLSAAIHALSRQQAFAHSLARRGEEALAGAPEGEAVWVVTGRPYNLHDERLNLQLGRHLSKLGIRAVPMDLLNLDMEDLSDFPRMYWGLGARILRAARRIAGTPNLFGVHITNFSCGADSFIEHFYQHILSEKPSLILELDEHSGVAGLLTRIEAYRNVVKNIRGQGAGPRAVNSEGWEASCA